MKKITKKSWIIAASTLLLIVAVGFAWAIDRVYHPFGKILEPQQVYELNVGSVHSIKMDGRYGSAVSISEDILVTNCHVLGRGRLVLIDDQEKLIQVINQDYKKIDLCFLYVPDLKFKPVNIRNTETVKIGEKVYAIGNPLGYEKTLSQGIVSNKVTYSGSHRLQTDAPISPGSSGGGLFDEFGNLIGVTSAGVPGSGNINFAAPTEPIQAVLKNTKITLEQKADATQYELARQELKNENKNALKTCAQKNIHCKAYLGYIYYSEKKYNDAYPLLVEVANHNIEQAHAYLAAMYAKGYGVNKNESKALEHAQKAAYLGDYQSAFNLGSYYAGKATISKNKKDFNDNALLAYAWFKVSGYMGAMTMKNGQPVPVSMSVQDMEKFLSKYNLMDQGETLADKICDKVLTCIRYDSQKEHKTLVK